MYLFSCEPIWVHMRIGTFPISFKGIMGLPTPENLILLHMKNKGTDQPAHTHTLISAFVIYYLESSIVNLSPCKHSIF